VAKRFVQFYALLACTLFYVPCPKPTYPVDFAFRVTHYWLRRAFVRRTNLEWAPVAPAAKTRSKTTKSRMTAQKIKPLKWPQPPPLLHGYRQ
jgi:hypothetical protein